MKTRRCLLVGLSAVIGVIWLLGSPGAGAAPAEQPPDLERPPDQEPRAAGRGSASEEPRAPAATPKEDKAKARKLFGKGGALYRKGQFREAIEVFREAYSHWKNPKILLNIAICQLEAGDRVEAVQTYRKALSGLGPEKRGEIEAGVPPALKRADAQMGTLKVRMPEEGAEVYVDGERRGSSPVEIVLSPGEHTVSVRLHGKERASRTIQVADGGEVSFELVAWPEPAEPVGQEKPGGFWARVKGLQTLPIYYFGAAALLTVVGAATLIGTGVKTEEIQDASYASPSLDTHDRGVRYRTATNVMIGITVVSAVAAGALAVFTDWKNPLKRGEAPQTIVLPSAGPGGGGISISGSF